MSIPARREATYEDLLRLPDHMLAQVLSGDLHVTPRPAAGHSGIEGDLYLELGGPFLRGRGGPGGWWLAVEPELHLGKDVVVPDLAGWRRERMPEWPKTPYISVTPDWVCEILSPSTAHLDRGPKLDLYARDGVPHAWLIDPLDCTLEAYALEQGRWVRLGLWRMGETVRVPPFDAVPLELAEIFRNPPEPERVSEVDPDFVWPTRQPGEFPQVAAPVP